jgi:hypothetical protein
MTIRKTFLILLLIISPSFVYAQSASDLDKALPLIKDLAGVKKTTDAFSLLTIPVEDIGLNAKETGIKIGPVKLPFSWNQLAIEAGRVVVSNIVDQTVDWINSGFDSNNSPAFVTNPGGYLGTLADNTAGEVISQIAGGNVCAPFKPQVALGLLKYYQRNYVGAYATPSCTFTGALSNLQDFYDNTKTSDWGTWFEVTQNPTNNPIDVYITAQGALDSKIADRVNTELTKLGWGQGFKSQGKCLKVNGVPDLGVTGGAGSTIPYDPNYPPGACIQQGPITTPGSTIKSHIDAALPANNYVSQIFNADQFDKLISAIMNYSLRRFAFSNGGLFGGKAADDGDANITDSGPGVDLCAQYGYGCSGTEGSGSSSGGTDGGDSSSGTSNGGGNNGGTGSGGTNGGGTSTTTDPNADFSRHEPAITSFSASPSPVNAGESVTLSWTAQYSTRCNLGHDYPGDSGSVSFIERNLYGNVAPAGSTINHTLTCYNDIVGGYSNVSKTITVTVQ